MEHGFYHPDAGYWQTTDDVPEDILATYPQGTVEVPLKPGADFEWRGGTWVHVEPDPGPEPVPVIDAIDLWQRASDEEAEAIESYMAQAPARVRNIFRVANTFRGDHEVFGMLKDAAETL
ncbi:MAG: hypothetical protein J0H80_05940, partial [Rhizobiales bacterium]|nr:hypothetical protein [Hyphomicrobiales bacterium]